MPKTEITRTELVWPGKYDEEGNLIPPRRVNLPFQVIKRANETGVTRGKHQGHLASHMGTPCSTTGGWRRNTRPAMALVDMQGCLDIITGT